MPWPPPSPSLHRLYFFQLARYHFHDLASNVHGGNDSLGDFVRIIQFAGSQSEFKWKEQLMEKLNSGVVSIDSRETEWIFKLRNVVTPDLRRHGF